MKLLLLVDGSSYLYRAFHALPDLRNRAGEPTGAIYGVINMLRKLHADYRPDYSACVFDAKGKTFRDDVYPEYKANRPPMPDDLSCQIEPLHQAIRALGWPLLMVDGVEADDVIATLADRARHSHMRTVISTGDKDLVQLVDEHTSLVNTMSDEKIDEAAAIAKYGVTPSQFVDYLALIGDSVDNVPGVAKVGPKTAAKWIAQYGTLDALMAHASEVGGVVGENLRSALDWLPQGRALLTVKRDVELPLDVTDLGPRERDVETLAALFDRFGFKTWRRELGEVDTPATAAHAAAVAAERAAMPPHVAAEAALVLDLAALEALVAELERVDEIVLRAYSTDADPLATSLVGIGIAVPSAGSWYIPLAHRSVDGAAGLDRDRALARLARVFSGVRGRRIVGHGLKQQRHAFANHGIDLAQIGDDVMLASYVLESHVAHDLPALARRHLDAAVPAMADVVGKGVGRIGFDQLAPADAARFAAAELSAIAAVRPVLLAALADVPELVSVYRDMELPVMRVLFTMERNGVLLDTAVLARQSADLGARILEAEARAYDLAGQPFNLNSPKQIQEILFDRQKLPVLKKTPGGLPSTDEDVLQQLALDHPLPKAILGFRSLAKLKSTYTDKLPQMVQPRTGRVHTTYAQTVAVTGRLASLDPNLQNIPIRTPEGRRIREAFVSPPGSSIVSADYSQIELRIMAHLSGDASLLAAFARGADIHQATAAEVFGLAPEAVSAEQRRYAKAINFGLIYGMSSFGLAAQLGIERAAAQTYIDAYFARYPGVADYMKRTREQARNDGFVQTVFGRRLWLPDIRSGSPGRRQGAERAAINAPMQGTAADLVKRAMIAVQGWIEHKRMETRLIMQVHDELVLEVPAGELAAVRQHLPGLMTGVAELAVPLAVDVGQGRNWDEAH